MSVWRLGFVHLLALSNLARLVLSGSVMETTQTTLTAAQLSGLGRLAYRTLAAIRENVTLAQLVKAFQADRFQYGVTDIDAWMAGATAERADMKAGR
jgi:hypothetical protein